MLIEYSSRASGLVHRPRSGRSGSKCWAIAVCQTGHSLQPRRPWPINLTPAVGSALQPNVLVSSSHRKSMQPLPTTWSDEARRQQATARAEVFGYACNRCSRCCYRMLIQVNPYEIGRLAQLMGVSTSAFVARWTKGGAGLHLGHKESGACVFLGPQGCEVHSDRPLACRLYPLGRHVEPDGTERWSHLTAHPKTAGVYSTSGTIADYIAGQGAEPFMRATDEYAIWYRAAAQSLGEVAAPGES